MEFVLNYRKTKHFMAQSQRRGVSDAAVSLALLYGEEVRQGVYLLTKKILSELSSSFDEVATSLNALRNLMVVTVCDPDGAWLVTVFKKYSAKGAVRTPARRDPSAQRRIKRQICADRKRKRGCQL